MTVIDMLIIFYYSSAVQQMSNIRPHVSIFPSHQIIFAAFFEYEGGEMQ